MIVDPWTGAVYNNGTWLWLDGTALPASYQSLWGIGKPNGNGILLDFYNEVIPRCAVMNTLLLGYLVDTYCMELHDYICEIK